MLYHRFTDEPTYFTLRSPRWIRDITWHLRRAGADVCATVQGGPPIEPIEILEEVHGAVDAGAAQVLSYPGLSWALESPYWTYLAQAYEELAEGEAAAPLTAALGDAPGER
jgi:hypothetical protein